jgi:hypothetical protein
MLDHCEPGRKLGPNIDPEEKRALMTRLVGADEQIQDEIWNSLPWDTRRQLVNGATIYCAATPAQMKRLKLRDGPVFDLKLQICEAQVRQQSRARGTQPTYHRGRKNATPLPRRQTKHDLATLREAVLSWKASHGASASERPEGCDECEQGQVNSKACPAFEAKGLDAAREHFTLQGHFGCQRIRGWLLHIRAQQGALHRELWGDELEQDEQADARWQEAEKDLLKTLNEAERLLGKTAGAGFEAPEGESTAGVDYGAPRGEDSTGHGAVAGAPEGDGNNGTTGTESAQGSHHRANFTRQPSCSQQTDTGLKNKSKTARGSHHRAATKHSGPASVSTGQLITAQGSQHTAAQHKAAQHRSMAAQHNQQGPGKQRAANTRQHCTRQHSIGQPKQSKHRAKKGKITLLWLGLLLSNCPNSEGALLSGGLKQPEPRVQAYGHRNSTLAQEQHIGTGIGKPGKMGKAGEIDVEIMVGTSEQEPD